MRNEQGQSAQHQKYGVVVDCLHLKVYVSPDQDDQVVTIITALTEVMVDMDASTDDFYKICIAAGIQGYCKKKYIALRREEYLWRLPKVS